MRYCLMRLPSRNWERRIRRGEEEERAECMIDDDGGDIGGFCLSEWMGLE